jgi:putative ABC transport system ATP-binding protein
MKLLGALNNTGRTIVIITHEEEIARFTQRVVRMRDGRIESDQLQKARTEVSGMSLVDSGPPRVKVSK